MMVLWLGSLWVVVVARAAKEEEGLSMLWETYAQVPSLRFSRVNTTEYRIARAARLSEAASLAVCELPTACNETNGYCDSMREIDILIPSYEKELCKLGLLAKSVRRHDACGLVRDVHIAWVSSEQPEAFADRLRRVEKGFGPGYRVAIHRPRESAIRGGWFEQQLVKLLGHAVVSTQWYLILDSKNVFVNPITLTSLFAREALSLTPIEDLRMRRWYDGAAEAMGIRVPIECPVKPTITPAIFNTNRVRSLLDWADQSNYRLVQFIKSKVVSEFALYEVFTCSDLYRGEPDPWLSQPVAESNAVPHDLYLVWNLNDSEGEVKNLEALVNDPRRLAKDILLLGWHHQLPDSNYSRAMAENLATIYLSRGVIQSREDVCNFYKHCMDGLGQC